MEEIYHEIGSTVILGSPGNSTEGVVIRVGYDEDADMNYYVCRRENGTTFSVYASEIDHMVPRDHELSQVRRQIADKAEDLTSGWGDGLTSAHVRNVLAEIGVLASRLQELESN